MKNLKGKIISGAIMTAFVLIFSFTATAQQKGQFGLRFMPTFSRLDFNTSDGGTTRGDVTLGYGFGAVLAYNFSKIVGVQTEVIYNSISQKYSENDAEHKIDLKYINIPLMLSLNTGRYSAVNFNIVGGPQIGLSVGSKLTSSGTQNDSDPVLAVKKGDLGVAYGAGFDFGLNQAKTFRLGIGFRGVLGLLDISDDSKTIDNDSYYLLDKNQVKSYSGYIGGSFLF